MEFVTLPCWLWVSLLLLDCFFSVVVVSLDVVVSTGPGGEGEISLRTSEPFGLWPKFALS